jgi:hypothetical protein
MTASCYKKIYEVIAVHFDDHIRLGPLDLLANVFHERFALHFSRRLRHLVNKPRRMRNSSGQDQFRHRSFPFSCSN